MHHEGIDHLAWPLADEGAAYIALLCQCFGGLQGQTTARVPFGEPQSFEKHQETPPWSFVAFQSQGLGDRESFFLTG